MAGESLAADNAVDRGTCCATYWQEVIPGTTAFADQLKMPVYLVTDCKSLYDCVISEAPNLMEKRTLIDILSIKQTVTPQSMSWVRTCAMLAYGLAKRDKNLRANPAN